jgi:hypothetical protein
MANQIHIEKHAPERRKKAVTTLHCGCTCCCCCCLHTIGSIIGAAVAPAFSSGSRMPITYYYDEETGKEYPLIKKPGLSSVTFFWWLTSFFVFLSFAAGIVMSATGESVLITAVLVLLGFPVLQLASAIITIVVYACWPRYDKSRQLKHLAKITGGIALGSIVGGLIMVGIAFVFGAFR